MSSIPDINAFKGTGWEECNAFIRALRSRSLLEGKQRDSTWMADFAGPLFSHKALLWHSRLPQDVRQDWFKLETALLERWAPLDEDDEGTIVPTPAAAPSISHIRRAGRQLQGVLKAVKDDSNDTYYVKYDKAKPFCSLTRDAAEALRVRCNSLSDATLLEPINGSRHSWLAIQWRLSPPKWREKSTEYAYIPVVETGSLKSSWSTSVTPWQLMICTVSTNGEVVPCWRYSNTRKIPLVPFAAGYTLLLAADPNTYSTRNPTEERVKLFIEDTD